MESKEDLIERKKMGHSGWFYAIQRIDLLIITISGAGVYVILETLKFSRDSPLPHIFFIKAAGFFLITAIIINFWSQFTGMKANEQDMLCCSEKLKSLENGTEEQLAKINELDRCAEEFTIKTNKLNRNSMITMSIGLITLILYFNPRLSRKAFVKIHMVFQKAVLFCFRIRDRWPAGRMIGNGDNRDNRSTEN